MNKMKISKQKLKNLQKAKKGIQNTTRRNSRIDNSRMIDVDDPLIYDKMLKDNSIRYAVTEKSQPEELYLARQEAAIKEFSKVPSYHDGRLQLYDRLGDNVIVTGIVSDIRIDDNDPRITLICIERPLINATKIHGQWRYENHQKAISSHLWLPLGEIISIDTRVSYISIGDSIAVSAKVEKYRYHNSDKTNYGLTSIRIIDSGVAVPVKQQNDVMTIKMRSEYPRYDDWIVKIHRSMTVQKLSKSLREHGFTEQDIKKYASSFLDSVVNTWYEVKPSAYNVINHPNRLNRTSKVPLAKQVQKNLEQFKKSSKINRKLLLKYLHSQLKYNQDMLDYYTNTNKKSESVYKFNLIGVLCDREMIVQAESDKLKLSGIPVADILSHSDN